MCLLYICYYRIDLKPDKLLKIQYLLLLNIDVLMSIVYRFRETQTQTD